MLLSEILHERVIKLEVRAQDKSTAMEELVDVLIEAGDIPMVLRAHVIEALEEREKSVSTGMGNGLALPHCATDRVDSVTGALGISRHGIDFVCRDGSPANILILLVIPRRSFQEHLHTVSSIARVMRQKTLREAILAARDAKTILHLIETEETKDGLSAAPKKGSTGPR